MIWHQNLQTLWLSGLHLWYERVFSKQRQHATAQITATHGTVLQVVRRVAGLGHKIFIDNYCTLPALFDDLFQRKINACGTVHHDWRGMPWNIGPKSLKMKRGDIATRVRGTLRAVRWKDRQDVYIVKHARSPCCRKFHPRIWPGYQTSCCRRLQCLHEVCGQVRQNGQQLWNCPQNVEVDQETVFSPNRHDHSKRISKSSVVCVRCTSKHGSVTICA